MTNIKIALHNPVNIFTFVKVLYTIKAMDYSVGVFELLDLAPHLPHTKDFERTLKELSIIFIVVLKLRVK